MKATNDETRNALLKKTFESVNVAEKIGWRTSSQKHTL